MEDRILVTGSTGFLGRALVASLSAKKYNVTAFLRPSSSESLIPQGTSSGEHEEAPKWSLFAAEWPLHTTDFPHSESDLALLFHSS